MSIDKFKSIRPKDADFVNSADEKYLDSLCTLKKRSAKIRILPVVGTVAAVFMALIAFTVWALIGRGVRGTEPDNPPVAMTPADQGEPNEYAEYERVLIDEYALVHIPHFTSEEQLRQNPTEVRKYLSIIAPKLTSVNDMNAKIYELFGVQTYFGDSLPEPQAVTDTKRPIITELNSSKLNSNRTLISLKYQYDNNTYSLQYFSADGIGIDCIINHHKAGKLLKDLVTVGELYVPTKDDAYADIDVSLSKGYSTVSDLFADSPAVIIADVISGANKYGEHSVISEVKVCSVLKGSLKEGDIINITETGTVTQKGDWSAGAVPFVKKNMRVVLFLMNDQPIPDTTGISVFGIKGCYFGKFYYDNAGKIYSALDYSDTLGGIEFVDIKFPIREADFIDYIESLK